MVCLIQEMRLADLTLHSGFIIYEKFTLTLLGKPPKLVITTVRKAAFKPVLSYLLETLTHYGGCFQN